jgi:hypothetical protein
MIARPPQSSSQQRSSRAVVAPGRIPADAWPYLVAIGFASTFLAIQTFYAGAKRIGAAQAALVSTIEPLIIVTLAAVLLDDVLAPIQLVGAGLILVGVVIAQTGDRPRGAPEPATPLDGELRRVGRRRWASTICDGTPSHGLRPRRGLDRNRQSLTRLASPADGRPRRRRGRRR